jgi:hypothetical protein
MRYLRPHEYFAIRDALEGGYHPVATLTDYEFATLQVAALAFQTKEQESEQNIGAALDIVDLLRVRSEAS